MMKFDDIKRIYNTFDDDLSRDVFTKRFVYNLVSDNSDLSNIALHDLVLTNRKIESFVEFVSNIGEV